MPFYFVTCRECGDDEDSGYVVHATDPDQAVALALVELTGESVREEGDDEEPETYVNWVVDCGDVEPKLVRVPMI